jgi:hypothetical protein
MPSNQYGCEFVGMGNADIVGIVEQEGFSGFIVDDASVHPCQIIGQCPDTQPFKLAVQALETFQFLHFFGIQIQA